MRFVALLLVDEKINRFHTYIYVFILYIGATHISAILLQTERNERMKSLDMPHPMLVSTTSVCVCTPMAIQNIELSFAF